MEMSSEQVGQQAADGVEPEVASLSYEQARDELVQIIGSLESGGASLADTMALWRRGEQLADVCDQHLAGAQAQLDDALAQPEV